MPSPDASPATPHDPLACVLVMPAYNEQGCIAAVVDEWADELGRRFGGSYAIVVVNDGSRDRTGAMLDAVAARQPRLRVIHQTNAGHGGALLRGYREALALGPGHVFQCDSDNQFLPGDFGLLWERRHDSTCILGFRSERHDALHRLVITRILRLVLLACFGRYLRDSNIPFRLFHADFLRSALALIPPTTFAPNIFLAVVAARRGIPLLHLPVRHRDRATGTVSIVRWKLIKICFRCVRELAAFRRILARAEAENRGN